MVESSKIGQIAGEKIWNDDLNFNKMFCIIFRIGVIQSQ